MAAISGLFLDEVGMVLDYAGIKDLIHEMQAEVSDDD